ncbi:Pfs domain-containing protein [Fusarium circinatum]|uniref:Pfs domain-containing protein n=1 Tax=Fusarium circinatum TaxID=48490 RepID=A0A8H5SMH9_FUSCI|nr:Pfs domain-containing protein [Fusarium circinatum]
MPPTQDYTIGWISALPLEMAAAMAALDESHGSLNSQPANDKNNYALGRIGPHNVVIACLPSGVYGTTSATAVAMRMTTTFPNLRVGLMVGIGGGVPSKEHDIRLGDVVVGRPQGREGGVVQYDLGKTIPGEYPTISGSLNKPDSVLLTAVSTLNALHMTHGTRIHHILAEMATSQAGMEASFSSPGPDDDHLYAADYVHAGGSTCENCDKRYIVSRPPRKDQNPRIFYGTIASGNQVIKDATTRDRLGNQLGALCFEMEAAGIMDHFPCLVIRGICDYADSHKNKAWQGYAAATAAAYAKEILGLVPLKDATNAPRLPQPVKNQITHTSFLATSDWFEKEDISLASLVPKVQYPDQDALVALSLDEGDVSIRVDQALSECFPARPSSINTPLKNLFRRVFGISDSEPTGSHWHVQATESRSYMLRQPRAIFNLACSMPEVREWLEDAFINSLPVAFIIGYRTALNARLAWKPVEESNFDASADHSRSVLGERIYAICYRKVNFRLLKGPESAFLAASNHWNLFTEGRGSRNDAFLEVDISDHDVALDDTDDSQDKSENK